MCCRGRNSRRGFGPRCGPGRGFIASPEGTYEQRPRGLFGFLAAKRAEKKAAREAYMSYENPPYTGMNASPRGGKAQQQQEGNIRWEDEKQGYEAFGFREESQVKEATKKVNGGKPENLDVTPPRYSMVMRE